MKKTLTLLFATLLTVVCYAQKQPLVIGQNAHWEVTLNTSMGSVKVMLYNDTPIHRDNFIKLCNEGFYNSLLFHRVINQFMIQCGDPKSREASQTTQYGDNDAGYTLPAEITTTHYHKKGALAAARTPDEENPERRSSGSQFYIVTGKVHSDSTLNVMKTRIAQSHGATITPDREQIYKTIGGTPHLDGSYTIFGEVLSGIKKVEKIAKVKTTVNDRPAEDVYIKSTTVEMVSDK